MASQDYTNWNEDHARVVIAGMEQNLTMDEIAAMLTRDFGISITKSLLGASLRGQKLPDQMDRVLRSRNPRVHTDDLIKEYMDKKMERSWATRRGNKATTPQAREKRPPAKAHMNEQTRIRNYYASRPTTRRIFYCMWDAPGKPRCNVECDGPYCDDHTTEGLKRSARLLFAMRSS